MGFNWDPDVTFFLSNIILGREFGQVYFTADGVPCTPSLEHCTVPSTARVTKGSKQSSSVKKAIKKIPGPTVPSASFLWSGKAPTCKFRVGVLVFLIEIMTFVFVYLGARYRDIPLSFPCFEQILANGRDLILFASDAVQDESSEPSQSREFGKSCSFYLEEHSLF